VEVLDDASGIEPERIGVIRALVVVIERQRDELGLAVGVPEMFPVDASVRPAGSAPELMDQERGAVPPLAVSVAE